MFRPLFAIALVAFALAGIPVRAATSDAAALKPIEAIFSAINTNSVTALSTAYASDAVIVDEFAPFQWSGPKAAATWYNDFGAFAAKLKMSQFHLRHAKPAFLSYNDAKTSAYVVMPATFNYMTKGKKQTEIGRWVFVLTKSADGWRVATSAWATVSDTGP